MIYNISATNAEDLDILLFTLQMIIAGYEVRQCFLDPQISTSTFYK
jgi:hypothetical protein